MDERDPPPPFSLAERDGFRTPETHNPQHYVSLGEHSTGNLTPATQIAQGAVGRRLNLEGIGRELQQIPMYPAEHPMASMVQEDVSQSVDERMQSAFTTPLQQQFYGQLVDESGELAGTPLADRQREREQKQKQNQNQKQRAVDEDFILNLNQEADLERLTRRA
ncbi:hypothetical protein LPJ56_001326, partial [Coemansia sp. RSA 2599]